MKTKVVDEKHSGVFTAIGFIIAGLLAVFLGSNQITLCLEIVGALLVVLGLLKFFFSPFGLPGLFTMVIPGALIFLIAWFVDGATLLGIALIISGLFHLSGCSPRVGNSIRNDKQRTVSLVISLALLILGVVILMDHGLADALIQIVGVLLIVVGVIELISPSIK